MELKPRSKATSVTSTTLKPRLQRQPQVTASTPQATLQRAMTSFTSTPFTAQRQAVQPVFQASTLQRQEEGRIDAQREPLQRQAAKLSEGLPVNAIQTALQRQVAAHVPLQAPARPQSSGDWVTIMRAQAQSLESKNQNVGLNSREYAQLTALQRQTAHALAHGVKTSLQPTVQRHAEFAQHAVTLQRHPLTSAIPRAALNMVTPGERPMLQRAVDEATQADALQRQQDEQALQLHSLQRQLAELDAEATQPVMQRIQERRGAGNPLPEAVQRHLEQGLNHDLSGVRIHDDSEADKMAKGVNAIAFTTGKDIFFQSGKFNPNTQTGMELLAHEVTHTVQQSQGKVGKGIDPDSGLENEARAMGRKLSVPIKTIPSTSKARLSPAPGKVSLQRLQESNPSRVWNDPHSFAGDLTGEGATLSISITNLQVFAKGVINGRFTALNGEGRIDGFMDAKGVVYWTAKYETGALRGKERKFHGRVIQKPNGVPEKVLGNWVKQGQQGKPITYALNTIRQVNLPTGESGDYTPVKDGEKLKLPNGTEITLKSKDFGPGLQMPTAGRYRPTVSQVRAGAEPAKAGENFLNPQPNNLDTVIQERDKRPSKQALAESRGIDAALLQANRSWTATEFMAHNGGYRLDAPNSVHTGWDLNTEQDNSRTATVRAAGDGVVFEVDEVASLGHTIVVYHPQLSRHTRYAHLLAKSIQVKVGQVVKTGQTMAMIGGSSGNGKSAWSPHLHFDVIKKYEGLQMWNVPGGTLKANMDYVKEHYEDPLIFLGKRGVLPPGITQAQFELEVPAALRNTPKPNSPQPSNPQSPAPKSQDIPATGQAVLPSGAGGYTLTNQQLDNMRKLQENGTLKWAVSVPEKPDAPFKPMTLSETGAMEIRGGEGASAEPYEDSQGYMTIGYGHLIDKNTDGSVSRAEWAAYDKLGFPRNGLTPEQQLALYQLDLKPAIDAVNSALKRPVTQEMFDALVSITFNHGKYFPTNSYGKPLFDSINRGEYSQVPGLFYQYNLSNGKQVKRLKNRRLKEATTFATPYTDKK